MLIAQTGVQKDKSNKSKMFLRCFSLRAGVRCLGFTNSIIYLILLCFAIARRNSAEKVFTLVMYAFSVYIPSMVTSVLLEFKGPLRVWRKAVMLGAWWAAGSAIILNFFVIGYVLLFVSCKDS